jgi:hypothetical protein
MTFTGNIWNSAGLTITGAGVITTNAGAATTDAFTANLNTTLASGIAINNTSTGTAAYSQFEARTKDRPAG